MIGEEDDRGQVHAGRAQDEQRTSTERALKCKRSARGLTTGVNTNIAVQTTAAVSDAVILLHSPFVHFIARRSCFRSASALLPCLRRALTARGDRIVSAIALFVARNRDQPARRRLLRLHYSAVFIEWLHVIIAVRGHKK